MTRAWKSVVALSGGVGGARLLDGLAQVLPPGVLTAIVNTGDDFEHWGLYVSPDIDTVMYTLSGLADEQRGWGLKDESFRALEGVKRFGGDDWFGLGDRDLATHLIRTESLRRGESLSAITHRLCSAVGVPARVLPMADGPCRTMIETTDAGTLTFQNWFVRKRAQPAVRAVRFEGAPSPAPDVLPAIANAEVVIIGPSNPYVSIDPILTRPRVREAIRAKKVVAVSPIVAGQAVKGPLATMIPQLTRATASAQACADHYRGLLTGFVVEDGDEVKQPGVAISAGKIIMRDRPDRARLAREVLTFAERLIA